MIHNRMQHRVCCDRCKTVLSDWSSDMVVRYNGLPIPEFDYRTGEVRVDRHECLCEECHSIRVAELAAEGIVYEGDGDSVTVTMPVPDDYTPPEPSWWERLKERWFSPKE